MRVARARRLSAPTLVVGVLILAGAARADDRFDFTTSWFQELRSGDEGNLSVLQPQLDIGIDVADDVTVEAGYTADVVSGATARVYSVDAVSTATPFEETHHQGRFGLGFRGRRSKLVLSAGAGTERDYGSLSLSARGDIDLAGRNTNLGLAYTHSFDEVCDRDNAEATPLERQPLTGFDTCKKNVLFGEDLPGSTVWHELSIDTTQLTLTQNLTPTINMQIVLYGQVRKGFQSNPYRRVRVRAYEPQENLPDVRGRLALSARVNKFLPSLHSAVHFSGRGYSDTWGVSSGTVELAYSQYAGNHLLIEARTRGYQQSAATFFKDAFFYETEGEAGAYFAGDRELSRLRHLLVGGKISYIEVPRHGRAVWGVFDEVRADLKADLLFLQELPTDPSELNPVGIDTQFLTAGRSLDGILVQLGFTLAY